MLILLPIKERPPLASICLAFPILLHLILIKTYEGDILFIPLNIGEGTQGLEWYHHLPRFPWLESGHVWH